MKSLTLLAAALVAASPALAQQPAGAKADSGHEHMNGMMNHDDPDHAVQGGGTLPEGWSARTDRDAPLTNVKFAPMGPGLHVTTGPAVILYEKSDRVSGPFHAVATFTQTRAPMHPEAYGLFFAGNALDGEGQSYTYFLVRGDGKFLVKARSGSETHNVTPDGWTASDAVEKAGADGKATNKLEIDATKPGTVRFLVNGTSVYQMDLKEAEITGIAGLRVNHNLDVHVAGFGVHHPM